MGCNPYESPTQCLAYDTRSTGRLVVHLAAWLACFLVPALAVAFVNSYPEALQKLPRPAGAGVMTRISTTIGVPADIVFGLSLIGCGASTILAPIPRKWKVAALLAWFPLMIAQLFMICLCLILLGHPL